MPLSTFSSYKMQKFGPSPSHGSFVIVVVVVVVGGGLFVCFYLGGRMAFKISSACFVGSVTQKVEGSLAFGGCGTGPEGPGCWGLTFSGRD